MLLTIVQVYTTGFRSGGPAKPSGRQTDRQASNAPDRRQKDLLYCSRLYKGFMGVTAGGWADRGVGSCVSPSPPPIYPLSAALLSQIPVVPRHGLGVPQHYSGAFHHVSHLFTSFTLRDRGYCHQ